MTQSTAIDWAAACLAYVHGTQTLADVSREFGATHAAMRKRCEREGWVAQRRTASELLGQMTGAQIDALRADALAEQNRTDLETCKAIQAEIVAALDAADCVPLAPQTLARLAKAALSVQMAARLAMGLTTCNAGLLLR